MACLGVGDDEHHVAGFCTSASQNGVHFLFRHEFGEGGLHALGGHANPGQPPAANAANHFRELVNLLASQDGDGVFGGNAPHRAAALDGPGEHTEAAVLHQVAQVDELHAKTSVGLVGAVALHGLFIGQAGQGQGNVHAQSVLKDPLDIAFADFQHVFHLHEGHFQVDLGEFRLTVGPEILVPEASGNLHIAVKAGYHGQLLVELGGLGQGVEAALVDAAGHQEIPGSFRGGLDEHGSFNLNKTVFIKIVPGNLGDFVAHEDIPL